MSQTPPAALVRLREADVVRFCGLDAAARGLELVSSHAVTRTRRTDGRLEALVADGTPSPHTAWVEAPADEPGARPRWGCGCQGAMPSGASEPVRAGAHLACAHVAAILTAWIRAPADFASPPVPAAAAASATPGPVSDATPRPHFSQPALLTARQQRKQAGPSGVADELARLPAYEVASIARRVLNRAAPDAETRDQLAAALCDPHLLTALLARLEPGTCTLLADILLLGGAVTVADLDGLARRSGRPQSTLRTEMGVLERHGLIFPARGLTSAVVPAVNDHPFRQIAGWRVPHDVRAALPSALPLAPIPTSDPHAAPPLPLDGAQTQSADVRPRRARVLRASPRELILALALLDRASGPINPFAASTGVGGPVRRPGSVSAHAPFPLVPGDPLPGALAEFARGAGVPVRLAAMARRVLLWARDADAYGALGAMPRAVPAEVAFALRLGFRLWRAAEVPFELADLALPGTQLAAGFDTAHAALRPASLAGEVAAARQTVVGLVALAQPGVWYPLAAFLDLLWRVHPLYLRGRQQSYATPAWWLERPGVHRPLRPSEREDWLVGEGEYARELLTGPLHWWGALDLAVDPTGALVAFRLSPLGHFLLGDAPDPPESELRAALAAEWGPSVLVTREGALAVHPLVAPDLLDALTAWARPGVVAGGRLVYTLAADLVCDALDDGLTPHALLTSLRREGGAAGERAAIVIEPRLRQWQAEYGRTRIETGCALIEARDDVALTEALAYAPEIAASCQRLGPALALVPSASVEALQATLTRRGYHL